MVRAGRSAKEILIPKISVTGLGDYTRNVGYKTGSITWSYETHTFAYDRGIRLFADVMDTDNAIVPRRRPSASARMAPDARDDPVNGLPAAGVAHRRLVSLRRVPEPCE